MDRTKLICIWHLLALFMFCVSTILASSDDFYNLLGLDKSATSKDIRKAFKKVALKMHPDKNTDDPEADSKFIRINRAYEVLKDDDLRKRYDQFGEEGLENSQSGRGYHSWSYYRDNFGIYDDDPEIITLSRTDFEASVSGSQSPWFINYYHPMCSHCHTLAPDWRWLSYELQGVVRIGAVNCDDEFHLCSEHGIRSYPTLLGYPGREPFQQEKSRDNLVSFILGRLPTGHGIPVTTGMLHNMRQQHKQEERRRRQQEQGSVDRKQEEHRPLPSSLSRPWLLAVFHHHDEAVEYKSTLMKLAAIFYAVVNVGRLECPLDPGACDMLGLTAPAPGSSPLLFYRSTLVAGGGVPVEGDTAQGAAQAVLDLLPNLPLIGAEEYNALYTAMERRQSPHAGWLVQFSSDGDTLDPEHRKISGLTASLPCHRVLCSSLPPTRDCDAFYITKTPAFLLFKPGGGYEMHQGRLLAQDIANFAREAAAAPQFRTLTPKEFPSLLSSSSHWFVDFYAPWCPPCMRLLPQFRRASVQMQQHKSNVTVNFGIIDCTTHGLLCSQYNVHRYPTTILYNHTTPHQYSGQHIPHDIVEFVKDTLNPAVVSLTPGSFTTLVLSRAPQQLWVVDFFAGWCGPCQAMAPEYRRFAREVRSVPDVLVGSVDCAQHRDLCSQQGVRSYPTVRLYRAQGRPHDFSTYNGHSRDASSFKRWLYSHLPSLVTALTDRTYEELVLRSDAPWLVDFYAPWCGHCHHFAPDFEDLARSLEGSVQFGKVDCQAYQWVCRGAGVNAYPSVVLYTGVSSAGGRQHPTGEMMDSLQPQAIMAHVRWKLQQRGTGAARVKDEL